MSTNFEQAAVELKNHLADGSEHAQAMAYFTRHFADVPEFREMGRPKQKPEIVNMVRSAVENGLDEGLDLTYSKFFYVKPLALYHGPCNFGPFMGSIFYFTDIKQGVISLEREGDDAEAVYIGLAETSEHAGVD